MSKDFFKQLQQLWVRLAPRQRWVVAAGTLLTLAFLGIAVHLFGGQDYKLLISGVEPEDAQTITSELTAKKIAFQLTADGKGIEVAADQLDAARMEIASQGSAHSGRLGFELFDKTSWGQTEFDERVNYQRALEGELERTIGTLDGVKSARVHLVLPTPSIFLDRERGAKASVALRMKHGSLSRDQLRAIARLVSGAVDDLKAEDVMIIDASTNETLGNDGSSPQGREIEAELTKRLLATLGPAVGVENLRASVNVEYDLTSSEESQDKYDPAVSAVLSSQKTKEQVGAGLTASGVAGTSANLPANTPGATSQTADPSVEDGSQSSSSENATFGVNKTERHTLTPAGRIRRITAAILVNDVQDRKQVKGHWVATASKRTPAQLEQLTELARGVLGLDAQRGDIVTVQNMAFAEGQDTDTALSTTDKIRTQLLQNATAVKYAALLILLVLAWALILRPVQKQILASLKELPASAPLAQTALAGPAHAAELGAGTLSNAGEGDLETTNLKRELNELIQAEPAAMAKPLQAWLREEGA